MSKVKQSMKTILLHRETLSPSLSPQFSTDTILSVLNRYYIRNDQYLVNDAGRNSKVTKQASLESYLEQ